MVLRIFFAVFAVVLAQSPTEAPLVGRPSEGFYGAVGQHVQIEMSAAPKEVVVEGEITLTLQVKGADNPAQIERPDLKRLPEFTRRFHIDDLPDGPAAEGSRVFRYRLRPKNDQVRAIPPLVFRYYDPKLKFFATTAPLKELTLMVKAAEAAPSPGVPMQEPDFLFEGADDADFLHRPTSVESQFLWLLAVLLVPVIAFEAWFLVWKRMRPNAAKLAQLRRSRSVRAALDSLKTLEISDPQRLADRVAEIVRAYIHERFGLTVGASTAAEIVAELRRLGLPEAAVEKTIDFFKQCDAARFGPPESSRDSLQESARQLVLMLEGAQ
jgi:hypothetical protein